MADLKNERYQLLVTDYMKCVTTFLNDKYFPQMLEKQLNRRDLDTVCAYELYQMKKEFVHGDALDLGNFVSRKSD